MDDALFEEDVEAAPLPNDADLKLVAQLAERQVALEQEIKDLQDKAAAKALELKQISEADLPMALITIGMTELKLLGGTKVELKEGVFGGITKEHQPAAYAWLESEGHGDLIKHTLTIKFGKGEEAWAKKFMRDLAQRKKPLNVERKDAIAPQTFGAFIREQARAAKEQGMDLKALLGEKVCELLGVYHRRWTEVILPKK